MKKVLMAVMALLVIFAGYFAYQGISMHQKVQTEEKQFHQLLDEYYTLAKSKRNSAETGSELNNKLVQIKQYPSKLLELKLVGLGKILTGIFILLFAILIALVMMPVRLNKLLEDRE